MAATSNGKHNGRRNGTQVNGGQWNGTHPHETHEPTPAEQLLTIPGHVGDMAPPAYSAKAYRPAAKLAGKVAIITGGDCGIGRAVALAYAREGADVAIIYCSHDADATRTRTGVEDAGRRALLIKGDISDEGFCRSAVKQVMDELGRLDILVSNAAVQERTDDVQTLSREQLERTFGVNVFGYFFMVQACLPFMNAGSVIIATGSEAGIFGSVQLPDYSATKGAVHAITRSLAQQLLPRGIRVNAVAPGPVWCERNAAQPGLAPQARGELGSFVAKGRAAQPEEVAPAYVFFASNADSGIISGQVLSSFDVAGVP
jgi:NAD(P)-dependent dehydrogenase (short-subunit alcohol dehydrogenase family)